MNLTKTPLPADLTVFSFGVGWDASAGTSKGLLGKIKKARGVDLDVSVIAFDADSQPVNCAFFNNLSIFGGAVVHTGDNRTGKGDGLDESVRVDLTRLPADVAHLACVLGSYKGAGFDQVNNIECAILDGSDKQIMSILPPIVPGNNAAVVALASRQADGWVISKTPRFDHIAVDTISAQSWRSLVRLAQAAIRAAA